ncbi:MAG: hypothetical protein R3C19_12840 [Planctomycetaceae bacterium]
MGKLKPFLIGCCVGAGSIFVALQYHLVRGHDGFQFIPRTPQHSLGLAYSDVRNWDAAQWADRPELARALVAHGSSDLIATTVADDLADSITSGNSTLDQLRSFINETPAQSSDADDLLGDPGFFSEPIRAPANDGDDIFRVPFPDSAQRIQPLRQLTETTESAARATIAMNPGELSAEDVFRSGSAGLRQDQRPETTETETSAETSVSTRQIRQETSELESLLFGDEVSTDDSSRVAPAPEDGGIFQDVTSALDRRASDALARARSGFQDELSGTMSDGAGVVSGYVRDRAREYVPESVSTMFSDVTSNSDIEPFTRSPLPSVSSAADGSSEIPHALKALQEGFDPFLRN